MGSIVITGAQIGRQQRGGDRLEGEKEYRHAFLVIEAKKTPSGSHRHVLCAESDEERDGWVEELVRCVLGTYTEEGVLHVPGPITADGVAPPRSSSSSDNVSGGRRRGTSKDEPPRAAEVISKGPAIPISQLPPDPSNAKLFNTPNIGDLKNDSPVKDSAIDNAAARRILYGNQVGSDPSLSSSLPTTSPLDGPHGELVEVGNQRSNSELGHYADVHGQGRNRHLRQLSPDGQHNRERKSYYPTLQPVISASSQERASTPDPPIPPRGDPNGKVKISGPINGTPIPAGYKFGKELQPENAAAGGGDRKEKVKSRSFWNFGRPAGKSFFSNIDPFLHLCSFS